MELATLLGFLIPTVGATWGILSRIQSSEKYLESRMDGIDLALAEMRGDRRVLEERIVTNEKYNKRELQYLQTILTKIDPSCPIV